jgi:hypothetical protein
MEFCGNKAKAAAYRARKKTAPGGRPLTRRRRRPW